MEKHKATIHIVDDDPDIRTYLKELISTTNFNAKVYGSATIFLKTYKDDGLGCLVLDLHLPGLSGLDLQDQLVKNNIDLPVIMISGYGDIPTAVKAIRAGILDFIEKPFQGKFMLERINHAVSQHATLRRQNETRDHIANRISSLTKREKQVMQQVVEGKANRDIASVLGISVKTVEAHRANVMVKMQANSIAELVRIHISMKEG